jgi:hypothetical protein
MGATRRPAVDRQTPPETAELSELDAARVPVACSLAADDQPAQLAEWTELLALVEHRERLDGGVRLQFAPDPALAGKLADLATREHACCSFFTFTLHLAGDAVRLDVQAPDDAAGVIADFFGGPV